MRKAALSIQHLLAMFGATVLVPLLTGFDPSVAIFCAGIGTLIFHFCTDWRVPVFLNRIPDSGYLRTLTEPGTEKRTETNHPEIGRAHV